MGIGPQSGIGVIGKLIEEWGLIVYYGANGAEMIRVPGRACQGDRYVRINDDMLVVFTGGVQEIVLSVPLGSPDSLDKLKSVFLDNSRLKHGK